MKMTRSLHPDDWCGVILYYWEQLVSLVWCVLYMPDCIIFGALNKVVNQKEEEYPPAVFNGDILNRIIRYLTKVHRIRGYEDKA